MSQTKKHHSIEYKTLSFPSTLIFDWHGTLVDTLDAMYHAIEDMLPQLEDLGLLERLVLAEQSRSAEDAKLVRYIRIFRKLHPKILHERRVSRTDIFDALFAGDKTAKAIAHQAYNDAYREHFGDVKPIEQNLPVYIKLLKSLGFKIAVATNRSREFFDHELARLDEGSWQDLFDATVCGDEVPHHKPEPGVLLQVMAKLKVQPGPDVWYIGDSRTDMMTAKAAGISAVFYTNASGGKRQIDAIFTADELGAYRPSSVIEDMDELLDLLVVMADLQNDPIAEKITSTRPQRQSRPPAPEPRVEPDWHPSVANLTPPRILLFDWHATLVDTLDAMYHAVDDLLPELQAMGLHDRLVEPGQSKSEEDAKLVEYVRSYRQLHPKVKGDRKISRTDIFEILFGPDEEAKRIAHKAFNHHYRNHFGTVYPFEPQVRQVLIGLRELGLQVGVITNRDREFFEHELAAVETTGWTQYFDTNVCGDDTPQRKPFPDQLLLAVENLGEQTGLDVWYIGDSTTDTIAAKAAGMTNVFFNGAQWDQPWLNKIFPGTEKHPDKPDVVVNDFAEFWAMVLACRAK